MEKKIIEHYGYMIESGKELSNYIINDSMIKNENELKEFMIMLNKVEKDFKKSILSFLKKHYKFFKEHRFYYYLFCRKFHQIITKDPSLDIAMLVILNDYYFVKKDFQENDLPLITSSEEIIETGNEIVKNFNEKN